MKDVCMYLIDGQRPVPWSLRRTVAALDQKFIEEGPEGLRPGVSVWPDGDVWLWLDWESGREVGYAMLSLRDGDRVLERLWIEPDYRPQASMIDAWDRWCDHYGEIALTDSAGAEAFMRYFDDVGEPGEGPKPGTFEHVIQQRLIAAANRRIEESILTGGDANADDQ